MRRNGSTRTAERVIRRFDELIGEGEEIKEVCRQVYFAGNKRSLDPERFEAWRTSCLSLLKSTFGSSSPHFDSFANRKFFDYYNSTQIYLGILKGAKEDLARGYFFHKDLMLSVNIFDALIGRAGQQVEGGRIAEARAVLRVVLAEILTKICENKKVVCEAGERAEALLERLLAADVLPDEVAAALSGLSARLEQEGGSAAEVGGAIETLVRFLDEYLGSQIIILN